MRSFKEDGLCLIPKSLAEKQLLQGVSLAQSKSTRYRKPKFSTMKHGHQMDA